MQIPGTLTRVALLALALAVPGVGRAEPVPVDSFLELSDAIVLGRLTIVDLDSSETQEKGTGYVTVEEVVAGPVEAGKPISFEWQFWFDPEDRIVCPPSYRYEPARGVLSVWFFRRGNDGALRPMDAPWNLEDPRSREYHLKALAAIQSRTERAPLLLSLIRRLEDP